MAVISDLQAFELFQQSGLEARSKQEFLSFWRSLSAEEKDNWIARFRGTCDDSSLPTESVRFEASDDELLSRAAEAVKRLSGSK